MRTSFTHILDLQSMFRFQHMWLALALCSFTMQASAQITHGGEPWFHGVRPEALTLPVLDRAALQLSLIHI
mgnify:FL=1